LIDAAGNTFQKFQHDLLAAFSRDFAKQHMHRLHHDMRNRPTKAGIAMEADEDNDHTKTLTKELEQEQHYHDHLKSLFPSLHARVVSDADTSDPSVFLFNTRHGIPIENDLFVGKVLLVIRPINPEDDPHYNEAMFAQNIRVSQLHCLLLRALPFAMSISSLNISSRFSSYCKSLTFKSKES